MSEPYSNYPPGVNLREIGVEPYEHECTSKCRREGCPDQFEPEEEADDQE